MGPGDSLRGCGARRQLKRLTHFRHGLSRLPARTTTPQLPTEALAAVVQPERELSDYGEAVAAIAVENMWCLETQNVYPIVVVTCVHYLGPPGPFSFPDCRGILEVLVRDSRKPL